MTAVAVLLAGLVCGVSSLVGAQSARPCPPETSEPYLVCQVDRVPRPHSGNVPQYPGPMLEGDSSGTVRLTFVVDRTGRVDPGSLTVVDSTNVLFSTAAEAALRTWTFEPGSKGGRPVAVRWEQIVSFSVPRDSELPFIESMVLARDTAPDGVPRIVVGVPAHEPIAILSYTNRELLEVQRAALAIVAPAPLTDAVGRPRVTMCLTIHRGAPGLAPDTATLGALEAPGRRAVIPRDCPPAYVMRMYDTQRAPPGYIDPYVVDVVDVSAWNRDILLMEIDVSHEVTSTTFRCWATRETAWRPACRKYRSTVG
jgi:TonB family protein